MPVAERGPYSRAKFGMLGNDEVNLIELLKPREHLLALRQQRKVAYKHIFPYSRVERGKYAT